MITRTVEGKRHNAIIYRAMSALVALIICISPVLTSQPVNAGPPPGSAAAAVFCPPPPPPAPAAATNLAEVTTDKFQYTPDETATINGQGYTPGSEVSITLTSPEGESTQWNVTADASGNISTSYQMANSTEGAYTIQLNDGTNTATTMFTDPTSTAILYPSSNVDTHLTKYVPLFHSTPNPNQNWKYVADPVSGSGSPATGNDGDNSVVYTGITGDSWGHNTPTTDIYQFTTLPAGYQLYTTSGSLQTPTPTSSSHTAGTWSNNNKVTMQWNSVPSGTVTTGPSVTVKTVCRENGLLADGRVQIIMSQPTAGGTQLYYYTPAQGQDMTGSWALYSVTMPNSPDGNAWTASDFTALKGGVALSEISNPLGWAGMTQMYIEVSPGVMTPVLANYNYHWDSSTNTSTTGTSTGQITLTDGTHTFNVNAQDTTGGTTPYGTSGAYLIDTKAPTLTKTIDGTTPKSGWYNAANVGTDNKLDVTLSADDTNGATPVSGVAYIVYQVGSGSSNTVNNTSTIGATGNGKSATQSTTFVISTLSGSTAINQGAVTLTHSAADVAGNVGSSPAGATQTIYIDTVNPTLVKTIEGSGPKSGWYNSSDVSDGKLDVNLNSTDATSGVGTVTYSKDGASTTVNGGGVNNFDTAFTINKQGTTTLTHSATDVAGNTYVLSTQEVKLDTVAPTLVKTINGLAPRDNTINNGWYNASDAPAGSLNLSLTSTDATSGVSNITYTKDGSSTTVNGGGAKDINTGFTLVKQGVTTLTHSATDIAGNTYVLTAQDVKLDTILPTLVKSVARTGLDQVTVTLSGADDTSGSGISNIVYRQDGGTAITVLGNGDFSKDTTFVITGAGSHALAHDITDIAGNQYVLSNQTISIIDGAGGGVGQTVPTTPQLAITLSMLGGPVQSFPVTPAGALISDASATSPDGLASITIPAGTLVLNSDSTPAYLSPDTADIRIEVAAGPESPEGYQELGSYALNPEGITFDRPITVAFNYDPAMAPENSQAIVASYDAAAGKWIDLETAGFIAADGSAVPNSVACQVTQSGLFTVFAK